MPVPLRTLIFHPQPEAAEELHRQLRQAGFIPNGLAVATETDFLRHLNSTLDIILAGASSPALDPVRLIALLRGRDLDIPLIALVEGGNDSRGLAFVSAGAADYVTGDHLDRLGHAVQTALAQHRLRKEKEKAEVALRESMRATMIDITERMKAEEQFERSTRQLAILSQMGQEIAASLELKTVLQQVVGQVLSLLGNPANRASILLPAGDELVFAESSGPGAEALHGQRFWINSGLLGEVARSGHPLLVADPSDQTSREIEIIASHSVRSLMAVPLKLGGDVIGVMEVANAEPETFATSDLRLVEAAATWAAIAISNARRHERTQRRLQESQAVASITQALNSTLDLKQILQMIVDSAHTIIPQIERAVIHFWDEEKQALRPAAVAGLVEALGRPDVTMRPGEGIAGRVIAEGIVINVKDTRTDPRYLRLGVSTHLRSLLVVPVQTTTRRLGTLSASSAAPHAFSEDDENLFMTFGVQAALAIENARLFEVERRRAKEAETLQLVTRTLISRLNLSEMLEAVVAAIASIANYTGVSVYLLENDMLTLQAQRGYDDPPERVPVERGVMGRVMRTGQPEFVSDVAADPDYFEFIAGMQAIIAVPLLHTEKVMGVLFVESDSKYALDDNDLRWLTNVGRQLGVAVENARLLADLAKALKQEQTTRARMVQTEKLAAMGRLVASVAHELNNPLQAIQNALYLVKQEHAPDTQAHEDIQVALTEADRMADLIGRLRETYRPAMSEEFRLESLNTIVAEVHRLITTHLRQNNITFNFTPGPSLPLVPSVRDQLKQVILNLCLNAVEAMPTGGQLTVRVGHAPETKKVFLSVADTGLGIEAENLANIFDPFFTTKQGGTGLGLAITYDIIQRHNGQIDVESQPGAGTTFTISLPADEDSPAPAEAGAMTLGVPG
jgi:signal transduction histidine kinase/DNA-binding NarL/FixJ family response regulator